MVTNDMEKTVAFYRDVLGSEIAMAHRTGNEEVRHYFITVAPMVACPSEPSATFPPKRTPTTVVPCRRGA